MSNGLLTAQVLDDAPHQRYEQQFSLAAVVDSLAGAIKA